MSVGFHECVRRKLLLIFITRESFSDTFCSLKTPFGTPLLPPLHPIPVQAQSVYHQPPRRRIPITLCCCYGNRPLSGGSLSPLIYSDIVWLIHSTT